MNDSKLNNLWLTSKINNFSIYAALDFLEHHYGNSIEKIPKSLLEFKSNINLSTTSTDISKILFDQPTSKALPGLNQHCTTLFLNNVGLLGIQGSMPLYYAEHALSLAQQGDYVLADFINIFNHRIIQLMYRLRKQTHLQYYTDSIRDSINSVFLKQNNITNLLQYKCLMLTSINPSVDGISKLLKFILHNRVEIIITKACSRWLQVKRNRLLFKTNLHDKILGARCMVQNVLKIQLLCSDREIYDMLLLQNKIESIKLLLSEYQGSFKINITLSRALYIRATLNSSKLRASESGSKLGFGIYI